jgi:DNA polymerase-3 subunit gamma/tau
VAEDLLRTLRDTFLLTAARGEVPVDAPEDERERLSGVGEVLGNALLVRGLETLGQAVVDMRGTDAADPRLVLEIALVRLARRDTGGPLQALADRVDRLEKRLEQGPAPDGPAAPAASTKAAPRGKKPALGAFKQTPAPAVDAAPSPDAATPAPSSSPEAPAAPAAPSESPPSKSAPSKSARAANASGADGDLDLDDVIVAWNAVLESLPRSLRASIQEAQPLTVDKNVITFGVSKTQIDNVKPKFQKAADVIREGFTEQLGPNRRPKFKFAVHSWTGASTTAPTGGKESSNRAPRRPARAAADAPPEPDAGDPGPEPPPDDPAIDLVDLEELVDAPKGAGAAVDSVSRLADAFGATVVEEVPRT